MSQRQAHGVKTLTTPALLLHFQLQGLLPDMDNIYETLDHEDVPAGRDRVEPKYENSGEAREQLYSEVLVHRPSQEEDRSSLDYMEIREGGKHSGDSSSSSDDEDAKARKEKVEPQPAVEVEAQVQEVSGEAHNGSRRSSSSSDSSASPGDPCDDPPFQRKIQEEDNAEDGMMMAYSRPKTDPEPQESVDYTLKTLESVSLDESSSAPADPNQPNIALYIKVRHMLYYIKRALQG